jgi:uncharacterized membrane protein YfcA
MLLFTTTSATIVYAQQGLIPWDYAGVLAATALVTTLLGQVCIDRLIKALGRASIVVVVLSGFFCIACALTYFILVRDLMQLAQHPEMLRAMGKLCK